MVPVAEAIADLPGSALAIREATPQALHHHYTRFDQVNALVGASEADADLGFMARLLALCSLPRTNPGDRWRYIRRNGPYKLIMISGGDTKLPFGNLPRLLLAWVCTEAVRTQSRELVLGSSLSEFMRKLDVLSSDSGGATGVRTRLRNQMRRLFQCHVQLIHEDERGEQFVSSAIADRGEFWWNERKPDEQTLWDSKIRLGEDFFNEIIRHPVPIDMNTLKALKRSSLGLDLYLWTAYRTFALTRPLRLSWRHLYRQFGAEPTKEDDKNTVNRFRHDKKQDRKAEPHCDRPKVAVGVDRLAPYLGVLPARVFHRSRLILAHFIPPDAAVLAAAAPPLAAAIPAVVAIPMSPLPPAAPPVTSIEASSPHLSDERSPAIKSGMTASVHRPTCVIDWVSRFAPPSVVIYAIPTALNTRNTHPAITA